LKHFVTGVLGSDEIRGKYYRDMSPADAKRVGKMHHDAHGVHGMAFSLDCIHFSWGKCPTKYHGQYKGKKKTPTVVVEAGCNYQLWFWHCVFGYVGTMNDINIWDSSKLRNCPILFKQSVSLWTNGKHFILFGKSPKGRM
jgi:hypothetical protein